MGEVGTRGDEVQRGKGRELGTGLWTNAGLVVALGTSLSIRMYPPRASCTDRKRKPETESVIVIIWQPTYSRPAKLTVTQP